MLIKIKEKLIHLTLYITFIVCIDGDNTPTTVAVVLRDVSARTENPSMRKVGAISTEHSSS